MSLSEFDSRTYEMTVGRLVQLVGIAEPAAQRALLLSLADTMRERGEILESYRNLIEYKITENDPHFPPQQLDFSLPLTAKQAWQTREIETRLLPVVFSESVTVDMRIYFLAEMLSQLRTRIRPEGFQDDFQELEWLLYIGLQSTSFAP